MLDLNVFIDLFVNFWGRSTSVDQLLSQGDKSFHWLKGTDFVTPTTTIAGISYPIKFLGSWRDYLVIE